MQAIHTILLILCLLESIHAQQISQPQPTLPVQSYSDDPAITGSSYSAALCSLYSILGTESAHGIGPLTPRPGCMSMTLQPYTSSVNGQTLPSSGIVTIFQPSSTSSTTMASPTTIPTTTTASTTSGSGGAGGSTTTTPAPRQSNAGNSQNSPPAVAKAIAKYNIGLLLFTGFALLAGVTYFLDELLGYLL